MKEIPITISPGELVDRYTILCIKANRIKDPEKAAVAITESRLLSPYRDFLYHEAESMGRVLEWDNLCIELHEVNERLWDIEDALRIREKDQRFDEDFIELARSVYKTNDRRAALKREISDLFGATVYEVKEHAEY